MKKLVYILAVSAVTFSFSGCTKDNQQFTPACETNNTGTLKVVCNLEDPYKVYLNNAYKGTVGAYTSKDFGDIHLELTLPDMSKPAAMFSIQQNTRQA
tara:strand:- start:184 stop:477 length:294 start_codon:yes stop_codon:yes gene_type:complete